VKDKEEYLRKVCEMVHQILKKEKRKKQRERERRERKRNTINQIIKLIERIP